MQSQLAGSIQELVEEVAKARVRSQLNLSEILIWEASL